MNLASYAIRLQEEILDKETPLRLELRNWRRAMKTVPFESVSTEVDDYLDVVDRKLDRKRRLAFHEMA